MRTSSPKSWMSRARLLGAFAGFVGIAVLFGMAPEMWAQEVNPRFLQAAMEAYHQRDNKHPEILPPTPAAQKASSIGHPSDWEALYQLQAGDRVVCRTRDGATHRGKFRAISSEAITLQIGEQAVGFRREQVLTVKLLGRDHRAMFALVGAAAGLGVMLMHTTARDDWPPAAAIVAETLLPAVGGGLAGRPRKTTIYRANP